MGALAEEEGPGDSQNPINIPENRYILYKYSYFNIYIFLSYIPQHSNDIYKNRHIIALLYTEKHLCKVFYLQYHEKIISDRYSKPH